MEHIKGVTLQEYASFNGPIPEDLLKKWAAQLSVALMTLHLNSVVMMDMAPKNLLVTKNRLNIKIIDFGLARDPMIMRYGEMDSYAGTPYFASPENAHQYLVFSRKSKFARPSSDWYALGVILHLISTAKELYNYPFVQDLSKQKHALAMQVLFGNISRGFKIDEEDRLGREDLMNFITSITKVDVGLRLGTTPESYERILDSPLFSEFITLKDFINRKNRPLK
jgi:serine/threonine protein kinase